LVYDDINIIVAVVVVDDIAIERLFVMYYQFCSRICCQAYPRESGRTGAVLPKSCTVFAYVDDTKLLE
jgi:hypothetical protein